MRTMREDDAVWRVVVVATYPPLDGSEKPRTGTWTYGPYASRNAASGGLTRLLKRHPGATSAVGWLEASHPAWVKVGVVRYGDGA